MSRSPEAASEPETATSPDCVSPSAHPIAAVLLRTPDTATSPDCASVSDGIVMVTSPVSDAEPVIAICPD